MSKILFFISVVCVLVISAWGAKPVQAQEILKIFKKDMPPIELMSEEEFKNATDAYEEYPVGARDLAYEVRIPYEWEQADEVSLGSFIVNENVLSSIAKYNGPISTGTQHFMLVQAIGLTRQMTAEEWMMQYLMDNNYSVNGFDVISDREVEALYIFVQDGVSFVTRARAMINGKNIVFVQHFLPIEEWHDNKAMQAQLLKNFKLKFNNTAPIIDLAQYDFLEIADFDYPEEWKIKDRPVGSIDRMSTEILNIHKNSIDGARNEILVGTIEAHLLSVYAVKDLDEEIEALTESMNRKGLYVQQELGDHNGIVFDDEEYIAETHVFELVDKSGSLRPYEFWVTILAEGDYFMIVTLLTPNRDQAFFKWSENMQIYKLVSRSFKLKDEDEKKKALSGGR